MEQCFRLNVYVCRREVRKGRSAASPFGGEVGVQVKIFEVGGSQGKRVFCAGRHRLCRCLFA